jgi:hypothetical protein
MPERNLHIVPWHDQWAVKEEGNKTPLRMLETREEAVREAQDMARQVMFSHIFLHDEDGTIEREIPTEEQRRKILH